jgi:hypothetical protein
MLALGLMLLAAPLAGQGGENRPGERMQQRERLERQVRQRFMEQVAERLRLSATQREAMSQVLEEGADARRELAMESRSVRRSLMQSVRDPDTPMERYESLLARLNEVREGERALERREEARLARVLDPRQRALFLVMRMAFNQRVRGMGGPPGQRGGGPGAGPPGSGGPMGPGGGGR